ncbi:MAG: VacJ family lipoprotein [Gammaproteobacteria bacterium]
MKHRSILGIPTLATLTGVLILLSGCTTLQLSQDEEARDPFEGLNRAIYSFNEGVDRNVLKPVATGYKNTIPQPVRTGVSNFFNNLAYPTVVINDLLQGKFKQGISDGSRFIANTVFGVLGIFDVATSMGMPAHNEDFGQTFAVWGIGEGPYLVLPLFGPSNPRDGIGSVLDYQADILSSYDNTAGRSAARALKAVDKRSDLLSAGRILDQAALDSYSFRREAYRQRRLNLIYDGNPPQQDFSNNQTDDLTDLNVESLNAESDAAVTGNEPESLPPETQP